MDARDPAGSRQESQYDGKSSTHRWLHCSAWALRIEIFGYSEQPHFPTFLRIFSANARSLSLLWPSYAQCGISAELMGSSASNQSDPVSTAHPRGSSDPGVQTEKRFGTFSGVYTPSILTILGVVMYLRFGWVVGNVGLASALAIVLISHVISGTTALSISSISTNRSVGAGGAYYIISRSLGAPAGAAIGIPLFLGQALSVSFYVVGFVETLHGLWPEMPTQWVGVGVCTLLALLSLKSADLALKVQYLVMGAIGLSLVSFAIGRGAHPPEHIPWSAPNDGASFAEVFAVFFPAVTGIMAGLGMSGDLKNPRRSLPRGTLFAVLTGFVIYMALPIWLAFNADLDELRTNNTIIWEIARFPSLIYLGVWGATLSSAIGSLLTAPRTIQALANDGLAPRFLGKGSGPYNEPRVALGATYLLATAGVLVGSLDLIAGVLTMFFLATYGLTNLACGLERFAASPSFRPVFKIPAAVSLAGAIACFYVMSVIDLPAMIIALLLCTAVFLWVQRRSLDTTYGDARHGIWSAIVRTALHNLRRTEYHALNWRPNLIIMGGAIDKRPHLLELGSTIVQDTGIVTYFQLVRGDVEGKIEERARLQKEMNAKITETFPNVFYRVDIVGDIYHGSLAVAQSYGVGSFEANTVMLGWMSKTERSDDYVRLLLGLTALDRSLLLVHLDPKRRLGTRAHVQVWWGGIKGNGGLMLLVAFLVKNQERWRHAKVSLVTVVGSERERDAATDTIARVLESARLEAEPRVIVRGDRSIPDIMAAESTGVDLAIIGIRLPRDVAQSKQFTERMNLLLSRLPTTLLVHSARGFQGEPVLFDYEEATQIPPSVVAEQSAPDAAPPPSAPETEDDRASEPF